MKRMFLNTASWLLVSILTVSVRTPLLAAEPLDADVLIIGAGLCGLSAAYQLQKAGKSVLVLEMSPHVGGRIRTASYPDGSHAEIGLEEFWDNNPAIEIFRELDVPLETAYSSFSSFVYQGKLYPFTQESNQAFLESILDQSELKAYRAWDDKMTALHRQLGQRPLPDSLATLQDLAFADWIKTTSGLPAKVQELVRIETEPEFATSWQKISALEGIAEWHLFSGAGLTPHHVVGGNQRAVAALTNAIGPDRIHLNQLATQINDGESTVAVSVSDQATFQQRVFRGRYLIAAIPLFRLDDIQFNPPLSPERKQAIQTLSTGSYFTAHVTVDKAARQFWTIDDDSVLPIISDSLLGVIYEGHSAPERDALLNLLVSGDHAERFNSRLNDPDQIKQILLAAFDQQWPGFSKLVKQIDFYRYHPRAIASWPVGRSRFDSLSESLRQAQGRVYFAGDFTEGTHSDGAVMSARRAAKAILSRE